MLLSNVNATSVLSRMADRVTVARPIMNSRGWDRRAYER